MVDHPWWYCHGGLVVHPLQGLHPSMWKMEGGGERLRHATGNLTLVSQDHAHTTVGNIVSLSKPLYI